MGTVWDQGLIEVNGTGSSRHWCKGGGAGWKGSGGIYSDSGPLYPFRRQERVRSPPLDRGCTGWSEEDGRSSETGENSSPSYCDPGGTCSD